MPEYIGIAFFGAVAITFYGLITKIILRYQICSSGFVAFSTGAFASVFSGIVIIVAGMPVPPGGAFIPLLLTALFAFGAMFSLSRAMQEGDASTVVPMMGLKIPFIAVLSYFIIGETHSWHVYLAVILSAAGAGCFWAGRQQRAQGGHDRHPRVGLLWAAFSAVLYAISDLYAKLAMAYMKPLELVFYSYVIIGAACITMLSLPRYRVYRLRPLYVAALAGNGLLLLVAVFFLFTSFGLADEVTGPNIVFALRGFMTLVAGYGLGKLLQHPIEQQTGSVYLLRTIGTTLLFTAVVMLF